MRKSFLLFFIIVINIHAEVRNAESALNNYYNQIYLGEKKTKNYYGPLDPRSVFSDEKGEVISLDEIFNERFINNNIQAEPFELYEFWFKKVSDKSTCPDQELGENVTYIRYLYRLLTMSYLFEGLRINHRISKELGFINNNCGQTYNELFSKCDPHTDDMKKFRERVYGKFVNEYDKVKYSEFSKKEIQTWLDVFHLSTSLNVDPTFSRLHDWCTENHKNCHSLDLKEIELAMNSFCESDKKLVQNICNETDDIQGASYAPAATEVLLTSNAFNLVNSNGMGEDCLRRYAKINSSKEVFYRDLNRLFPTIYNYLVKEKSRYIQGELFLPGSLKEFDIKGLSDFLVALKPPKIEVIVAKAKPKIKPVIIPKLVEAKKAEPLKVEPTVIAVAPVPILPKVSEFEKAVAELTDKKLEHLSLNMDQFRDDYEFTSKKISELTLPIKKFQTREALTDMKTYDHLGSHDAPMGILFLKFLIDTNNHQGLYNILSILGNRFYVINDLEGKTLPVYIELKNDQSTKNRWLISLIKNSVSKSGK